MPEIGVIVPVYKVEPYLRRCVDSILAQTLTDFELILVDDGSPDNCGAICDEYAQKDARVHVIHQENGGVSAARNAGIDWVFANSDSEWISFVDSDDWVHSKFLELLFYAVKQNNTQIASCRFNEVNRKEEDASLSKVVVQQMQPEQVYVEHHVMAISAWAKLFSKRLFCQMRFPEGKICEDAFTTYKIIFSVKQISVVDELLYYYYSNAESIMRAVWSPKRMDEIQAREEQVRFFLTTNYYEAQKRAIQAYIGRLVDQIKIIKNSEWREGKYERILHAKLRKALLMHHKYYGFSGNEWAYDVAFPKTMQKFWVYRSVKEKIDEVGFLASTEIIMKKIWQNRGSKSK